MKRIFLLFLCCLLLYSCYLSDSSGSDIYIDHQIIIKDSDRELISGLDSPTVDYVLLKDGEDFKDEVGISLTSVDGTYSLPLNLISGSTYTFESFTIKSDGNIEYILDDELQENIDGFTISADGIFSVDPKVFLVRVTGILFETVEYESVSVEISTDESSYLDPVDLTFKVSSNIPDATFQIYKYTIYWVSGPELEQNEIFDMDTGNKFDPLIEGDETAWGSGKYKIETNNSSGETIFITGFSDEWSKKHIHLVLD